jgi:hypothetical protein
MNLHYAAALALVGWYLIIPPRFWPPDQMSKPLGERIAKPDLQARIRSGAFNSSSTQVRNVRLKRKNSTATQAEKKPCASQVTTRAPKGIE